MRKLSSLVVLVVQSLSHVQHLVTPWTVACQAPLPLGFPGKNTGVGCHFLFQGIFLTQGSNPHLLHCQVDSFLLSHQGSPLIYLFSSVQLLSCVQLFATPWIVPCQAPLFMGFPGKNTGVGCHALLQGIFLIQGTNLRLLHCEADSL